MLNHFFLLKTIILLKCNIRNYLLTGHKMCQIKFRDIKFGHRSTNEEKLIYIIKYKIEFDETIAIFSVSDNT